MDTIAQAKVDDTKFASKRQSWFWSLMTENVHPFALSAGKNHG
jgi:hypothetical protein